MTTQKMALFGILAFLSFTISFLTFAAITPGYSHAVNTISELGIAGSPYAAAWNGIGFGLVGLLVLPLAWSLWHQLRPASSDSLIAILVAISGIGWSSLGLFPASPGFAPSTATTLHFVAVGTNYTAFLLAAFIFAIRLRNQPYWRSWALASLILGLLGLTTFFIPPTLLPAAISQRLALVVYFLWLLGLGWAVMRQQRPSVTKP